jgi:hypothetical protein
VAGDPLRTPLSLGLLGEIYCRRGPLAAAGDRQVLALVTRVQFAAQTNFHAQALTAHAGLNVLPCNLARELC